jgi:formate hydrogenlyase subunit 4
MALPAGSDSPGGSGTTSERPPQLAPEIGIIVGAALLVLALVATFFLKGAAGSVLATLAFCYSVFVSYPPAVLAAFAAGRREGNVSADQIGQILSVKPETLFYLVLVLLVLAIVFNIMAMRKPGTASTPAESAP